MKSRIIFKIILGYVLLISVSFITGYIIYNQIQKLTFLEEEGIYERRKVLKISKILTLMNETESAGKIAIRTDDEEALNFFLDRNYALQDSIIKFKKEVKNSSYVSLFDSVQILLELKSENLQELKILQSSDSSSVIIRNAIEKLSSLEPTLGYFLLNDNAIAKKKRTASKSQQTLSTGTSYASIIQKYKNIKIPPTRSQQKFDNTVLETLQLLNKVHEETIKYKDQQSEKIHTLWHTDNLLSDKLHQLLSDIEDNILKSAQEFNEQRQAVFEKSRSFLTISYVIALLLMVVFSFIVINDFWKIQRIRQKLEVANLKNKRLLKSREQLISMVSHDLRTPLSSIIGYTELLDNQSTNEKTKNYLSNIKHASDYITKLVDELLDYSKIEAGKISLEKVPLNVSELIEEVATNIYSIHKSKPVELIFNFSENVQYQWFSSDPYRIKQILYNLISNAFKFTDKGQIRITTTEKQIDNSKFEISISVSDTGIGIKKEQQAHIFDEFTQANQEVSKQYGGSGLGLHISQKLAQLLKGNITLESQENKGSTFTLTFVTSKISEQPLQADTVVEMSEKAIDDINIVIIDDDTNILSLMKELCKQKNIGVSVFDNSKDAITNMETLNFDLVITDIQLPEMNGFHFVTLFNEKYGKSIPVLAITGRKDVPNDFYVQSGFSGVLHKPFSPTQFYEKLQEFFPRINTQTSPSILTNDKTYKINSLEDFMGDDKEQIITIYKNFCKDTFENIATLKSCSDTQDYEKIRAIAHKMLTMFGQIQATREVILLRQLEEISEEDPAKINLKIQEIERLFIHDCKPAIDQYCEQLLQDS